MLQELLLLAIFGLVIFGVSGRFRKGRERISASRNQKLLSEGVPSPATILSIKQTGLFVNEQPEVEFKLKVEPKEGMPFEASAIRVVSLLDIPRVQPGHRLTVRYDPSSLSVAIEALSP